jgi:sigma54-dependent transcription regulator
VAVMIRDGKGFVSIKTSIKHSVLCQESATLSDAGRKLFAATREQRKTANDADRLRKYLTRFDLDWSDVKRAGTLAG